MNSSPSISLTDKLKKYLELCMLALIFFMLPFGFTGQYLIGVFSGLVFLYLAYRIIMINGDTALTPWISSPAASFAVVTVIVILVATLGLFIHWQPLAMPEGQELLRHVLTIGGIVVVGAGGYFFTGAKK